MQSSRKRSPEKPKAGGEARRAVSRSRWLVFGGAALVALLVYLPTLKYGFVWDDGQLIVNNQFLGRANPLELFTKGFWNNPETGLGQDDATYYRPLTNLSFYLDRKAWGIRPTGFHLTNVIINSAVVFLVCLLLWELFGSVWLAGLGGLLVGIHPAMNCVVTFISNRTYLLALFFLLLGAYALARGRRSRMNVWPWLFGGSLLLSALALEASLVFAALAAFWIIANRSRYGKPLSIMQAADRPRHPHPSLPLKGEGIEGRGASRALLARKSVTVWVTAMVAPMAVYFVLRLGIARVGFTSSVGSWAIIQPLRVINAFGQQLQLLLFPFNQKVIYVPSASFTGFSLYTVLGLLFLGLPLYALFRLGRSGGHKNEGTASTSMTPKHSGRPEPDAARLGWYGFAWVVLFLLPFAHLLFLGPAGRMLYLAAPGALILSAALYRATSHKRPGTATEATKARRTRNERGQDATSPFHSVFVSSWQSISDSGRLPTTRVIYIALLLYTTLFVVQTLRRNPIWRDELSLSRTMVQEAPESAGGHLNYGLALARVGSKEEAIEQLRIAEGIRPDYVGPHLSLAFALIDQNDLPGAIRELREVVRLQPESPKAHNDLGVTLMRSGQFDSAIAEYKEALRLNPNSELTLNNLGHAYLENGDVGQAISFLKAALRLKPDFAGARRNLADAYREAGMPDSAALVEDGK